MPARLPTKKRAPKTSLRDRLNERTREVILDAMVDHLGESGGFDFSVFEVARRANVSPRTIYRHFPTRDDLFSALAKLVDARVGLPAPPAKPAEIVAHARRLFAAFDRNEELIVAQLQTPASQTVRGEARRERARVLDRALDDLAPDVPAAERRPLAAVCHCLVSADAWRRMRTDFDLDGAAAGDAVAWALETIFAAVAERGKRARHGKKK